MGISTDFFVASPEAGRAAAANWPAGAPSYLAAKNVDTVKLEGLATMLGAETTALDEPLAMDGDWWLFALGAPLTTALAELDGTQREQVACDWSQSPEWLLDGGQPDALRGLLEQLGELARKAQGSELALLMRMAL